MATAMETAMGIKGCSVLHDLSQGGKGAAVMQEDCQNRLIGKCIDGFYHIKRKFMEDRQ
jgi:hypothetical protein